MRKVFEMGGLLAAIVLIGFGVGALVMSVQGHSTVNHSLKLEGITGSADMTPTAIKGEAGKALANVKVDWPSCSVAGKASNTGDRARCFASYMRIHTLEATGGLTYAEMPRYATADGKATRKATVAAGKSVTVSWATGHGWYDVEIRAAEDAAFRRRLMGHLENGRPSVSG